jgi:hypothetical protein
MRVFGLLLVGSALAAGVAGLTVALALRAYPGHSTRAIVEFHAADWDSYAYQPVGQVGGRTYDVCFRIRRSVEPMKLRLLLNLIDRENYHFVEFTGESTRFGKVLQGFEEFAGVPGPPVDADRPAEILVKCRDVAMRVHVNGRVLTSAFDDSLGGGTLHLGQIGKGAAIDGFRVQPVSDVFFTDDFMKAATETGAWDVVSGQWVVSTLHNPALSTNAFFYVGTGGAVPALSTAGHWFWDDYTFQVACKPMGSSPVGVLAAYESPDSYCLFRWGCTAGDPALACQQLIRRARGQSKVLAERKGGYATGRWYELRLSLCGDEVAAFIDGNPSVQVRDPSLSGGKIGVCTEDPMSTQFDDAFVTGERHFEDDFESPCPGKWQEVGGAWRVERTRTSGNRMRADVRGKGKLLAGGTRWREYRFSADVAQWTRGAVGLCVGYLSELNCYQMLWQPGGGRVELVAVVDGVRKSLDTQAWSGKGLFPVRLTLEWSEGLIRGLIDGKAVVEGAAEDGLSRGKIGLLAEDGDPAFDNVSVAFPSPAEPVLTLQEVFAGEQSMAEWSRSESDWLPVKEARGEGDAVYVYWHRADFPGDSEIEIDRGTRDEGEPEKVPNPGGGADRATAGAAKPHGGTVTLLLSGDGTHSHSGYSLVHEEGMNPQVSLRRQGKQVAQKTLPASRVSSLKLSRKGRLVQALADGRRAIAFCDADPLPGSRVAVITARESFSTEGLKVYSPNLLAYSFQQAPDEWREAGGTWEVTNRWQCDPRWSFFSGRDTQLAAIWNKRRFTGDLTLEFCAATKMAQERGNAYQYAGDINATVCADGRNLTSGYSFLFGGMKNRGTQIFRKGQLVAESPFRIPAGQNIHRRWFYVKIRKQGRLVSLSVDNQPVVEYTDPDPLVGEQLALWTYNNGIMVTRVRISSESGRVMEMPDPEWPRVARCLYDGDAP